MRWRDAVGPALGVTLALIPALVGLISSVAFPPPHARGATLGPASTAPYAPPYGSPLALSLSDRDAGYVAAQLDGVGGASVQLSELRAGRTIPLQQVRVPTGGRLAIPRLLTWRCAPRRRTVVAELLAPDAGRTAATITTPSCAHRLALRAPTRSRVGASITVTIRDRWRLGGTVDACLLAPGGDSRCVRTRLGSARGTATDSLRLPRPGAWLINVAYPGGPAQHRTVWAEHRGGWIRLLAAGDSEMQILDDLISRTLASDRVRVSGDARVSTGLTNSFLFDWQREARARASGFAPDVTVVFIGANDGFSVAGPGGGPVSCCSSAWSDGYGRLVAAMIRTLLRRAAGRVYWCLLPAPRPANFHATFDAVNAGIRRAVRRFPGRAATIDTNRFFTPADRYRDVMSYGGHGFVIHEADGIHLSAVADAVLARLIRRRLVADRVIR